VADRSTISLKAVSSAVDRWRGEGQSVVLTNGVFDILHVGHVATLEAAAAQGDKLVVAVNADVSVKRLGKGDARPYNHEEDRAHMIAALRCVDAVVLFEENSPLKVVQCLRPDVLVKGGDYDPQVTDPSDAKFIVGSTEVRSAGGKVVAVPLVPGRSTTTLVERIQAQA
jgi:D-beta-D-heptose 7-phosphate kinase/D-beta-D-heptose 1-phosphate adenosyltransferase